MAKIPGEDVGYISGIKHVLKSGLTLVCLTWRASLISIHHLPKVSMLSFWIQLGVHLFCIFFTLVYGLLSRSLSLLPPPPLLPNRSWKTLRVLLPVKFSFACEACWWPHAQPLLGQIWIIYPLNLAQPWHFDVWCPPALALTIVLFPSVHHQIKCESTASALDIRTMDMKDAVCFTHWIPLFTLTAASTPIQLYLYGLQIIWGENIVLCQY